LNIGCIPSKALLTSSDHFMFAKKEAAKHGIVIDGVHVDLGKMQQRKDKVVKTFTGGVRALMKTNKVTTFEGFGTITAPGKSFGQIVGRPDAGTGNKKHRHRHRQRRG
jgi:Pyruvate/2-oxoglutarate dehydrogenase complex, dihydrolipoamide dehydrogenase (E3) component, and related enzymes